MTNILEVDDTKIANAFASTFYFFADTQAKAEKNKKSLQANAPASAANCANLTRHCNGRTEARTDNSGFKKLAVQWLIEHSTSHQHLWWLDSWILRSKFTTISLQSLPLIIVCCS